MDYASWLKDLNEEKETSIPVATVKYSLILCPWIMLCVMQILV